ncbi:PhoH family protein [Candidatus Aalborgicola defluviihabitans]|uniref:PhoH family protein n=1 Tax=Candidatus Aalborgicola defluviihabitans TaxID=3386187 RepID=UPI001E114988|nr:PhoH family protein [Burkholderiales bacterium]MBK6567280.1 PhoH family protein [Burkholderiales bacterium]MBK7282673.1 PhoH family protein [Burkholderiales bacterium]MBL0245400.1 PhoH family protein [Rhodoferax sp.]
MPLPPAPTKPADRLPAKAFAPSARAISRPAAKSQVPEIASVSMAQRTDSAKRSAKEAPRRARASLLSPEPDAPQVVVAAPVSVEPATRTTTRPRKSVSTGPAKLFVLDTNVLLHDPMSLFRFEEHDIYLPMIVLEELDGHKKGMTEVARNARQTSRTLDALAAAPGADIAAGFQLSSTGHRDARGKLLFQTQPLDYSLPTSLPQGKADNQILGVVEALRKAMTPREVVLVSKDINMRVKARALGLATDDYQNDKTLEDGDLLYSGAMALPTDFWATHGQTVESWQQGPHTFYKINGPVVPSLQINQFVFFESPGEPSLYARVTEIRDNTAVIKTLRDFNHLKNAVWGITTRNREQNFAMNLLMDPEVDFVTLTGTAGTGKTLMALAAGLTQVLEDRRYTEIIVTRATVSVGEDIGFLPGTEEEKMGPWMGALDDNLEVLGKTDTSAGEWGRSATNELIRSRIKIKSMNFMRGRTFMNKYVIIDEAQNLTPKQMKTLITRAGPGTKIICMGNLAQIDTPYLTEGSSGLTFAVDRFKGWPHGGHITLARGERSRLADFASEVL